MVAVLVVLTFAVFVALDFYLESRHAHVRPSHALSGTPPPLSATLQSVPPGVFVQPTYTWSRLAETGELYLGVHPLLLNLVGQPVELECLAPGDRVRKGEALLRLGRGGKRLTVRSPVAARVELVNYPALGGPDAWPAAEGPNASWLYRLTPESMSREVGGWLSGDAATAWARRSYADLRQYLQGAVADRHLGAVMADGGELPVGILAELDERVWSGVDERLLAAAPAGRTEPESTP